ncbi:MAG: xylulokinase [Anaerolineae bacterium]|nr:xylulokinase [Anaerolineae bacterium]
MSSYFIGIDVSTTSSKALAIDEQGHITHGESFPHDLATPRPLWAEQDPEQWWSASAATLRSLLEKIPAEAVKAIGLTGQMLGLTPVDKDGHVIRPAILWNDLRSGAQCDAITEQFGAHALWQHIGSMLLPGMTLPKIIWMREHEPDNYAQIAKVMLPKDFVRFRLSGAHVTDIADGSGFGLLDVGKRQWSGEMLALADIPRAWLPELCESPDICAYVSEEAAALTGLIAGTPIVGGAGDQPAQAVGSGIVENGQTSLTVGTSGVLFTSADRYLPDEDGRLHTFCHAIPGCWCYLGVMQSAAGSLRWLHDEILPDRSYDALNKMVGSVPRGANGLLFAPYLSGERHPYPDPLARGAFVGFTLRHGLAHMVRSTMEGVAFGMRDLVEIARDKDIYPPSAAVSGGAANSPIWRQIITDVMNMPLYTVNTTAGGAFGAAILAAVGAEAWPDVPSACHALIQQVDTTQPDATGVEAYERIYAAFRQLYPALKDLFVTIAPLDEG